MHPDYIVLKKQSDISKISGICLNPAEQNVAEWLSNLLFLLEFLRTFVVPFNKEAFLNNDKKSVR